MSGKKGKPKAMSERKILFITSMLLVGIFAIYFLGLWFLHSSSLTPKIISGALGVKIDRLGQLGESFGPITAVFAAIAAVGAWMSYRAQRMQLDQERRHRQGDRFDETFFRLLDFYDKELIKLAALNENPIDSVTAAQSARVRLDRFRNRVQEMKKKHNEETRGPFSLQTAVTQLFIEHPRYSDIKNFSEQLVAITQWLYAQRTGVAVRRRGALLSARLSDSELWIWCLSIARNPVLVEFAQRLNLVGEGGYPPKRIGTGRVFQAYDLAEDTKAMYVQADRYFSNPTERQDLDASDRRAKRTTQ